MTLALAVSTFFALRVNVKTKYCLNKKKKRRFMGQTSCILLGFECQCVAYAQWINVMVYFKPGELMRMMYCSVEQVSAFRIDKILIIY